jgi:hypothetical protein
VQEIAQQDAFDLDELKTRIKELYNQGLILPAGDAGISSGKAKKFLDTIKAKRSSGVGAVVKAIKIKIALKGTHPESLTPETPDDPVLLRRLLALAQSHGLRG